jgi:hypothetical protein
MQNGECLANLATAMERLDSALDISQRTAKTSDAMGGLLVLDKDGIGNRPASSVTRCARTQGFGEIEELESMVVLNLCIFKQQFKASVQLQVPLLAKGSWVPIIEACSRSSESRFRFPTLTHQLQVITRLIALDRP